MEKLENQIRKIKQIIKDQKVNRMWVNDIILVTLENQLVILETLKDLKSLKI